LRKFQNALNKTIKICINTLKPGLIQLTFTAYILSLLLTVLFIYYNGNLLSYKCYPNSAWPVITQRITSFKKLKDF